MAYKQILIKEMTDFLKAENGWQQVDPYGQESYFDFKKDKFVIRVYSSIIHGISRKKARDAIRVCLLTKRVVGSETNGSPALAGIKKFSIVRREENWKERLRLRVMEAFDYVETAPECPRCKSPLSVRTARETKSKFYGCARYPFCRHTEIYYE